MSCSQIAEQYSDPEKFERISTVCFYQRIYEWLDELLQTVELPDFLGYNNRITISTLIAIIRLCYIDGHDSFTAAKCLTFLSLN